MKTKKQKVWGILIEWGGNCGNGTDWAWSMDEIGGLGAHLFFDTEKEADEYKTRHWPKHSGIKNIEIRPCYLPQPLPKKGRRK